MRVSAEAVKVSKVVEVARHEGQVVTLSVTSLAARGPTMDISTVVKQSGLPPSTLHHYESKGLIKPSGRNGLRRQYDEDVLDRLAVVSLCSDAGFSLDEIGAMLPIDGRPTIDPKALDAKADELDRTISALVIMRENLRHAAKCKAPNHLDCPKFRKLLDAATQRRTAV